MDACDVMIKLCEASIEKYQKSGNRDKVLDYQESIDTFVKWKRRAE